MDLGLERCYASLAENLRHLMNHRDIMVAELLATGNLENIEHYAADMREKLRRALVREFQHSEAPPYKVKSLLMHGYHIDCYLLAGAYGCDIPVNLYIPQVADKKCPAVIVPVGHWPAGKADENVQKLCAGFAQRGIIAATYDPVNQGERCPVQPEAYLRAHPGLPQDMLPVAMHMLPGNLFYMLGENLGSLFVWEGMRVCNLLCELDEVDRTRIGVTGQSGGGTQSHLLAALDERIMSCSPVQCLTKLAGIVINNGIGDCEQSILDICKDSCFDYADYLWALYPKPLMINAARDDYFTLDGVITLYEELDCLYRYSDTLCKLRIADCGHVMGQQSRWFALDFFLEVFGMTHPAIEPMEQPVLETGELDCMENPSINATFVAQKLFEVIAPNRPVSAEKILGRVVELINDVDLPAAEFHEQENGSFFIQAGPVSMEGVIKRRDRKAELLIILGPISIYKGSIDFAGSYVIADPMCMGLAMSKNNHGYDAETRLFNLGAIMGYSPAKARCGLLRLLLDELAEQVLPVSKTTLAAGGIAGVQALYMAAVEPRITKLILRDVPDSLDAGFYDEKQILPETMILPGSTSICDLKKLANCLNTKVIWNRNEAAKDSTDLAIYEALRNT